MNHLKIVLVLCLLLPFSVFAQPNYPAPTGLYCSCGPTTGSGFGSVNPQVASKDFVEGILVRVVWEHCEKTDSVFDWSLIEGQIQAANSYNKKISLAVGSGPLVPDWVYQKGAISLQVTMPPSGDTIAVPWDSVYLHYWTRFVSALGERFDGDSTIRLVYISNSSTNGFEMQLPFGSTPTLTDLSYSDAKMIASWKKVVDAFGAAFPSHYLSNDFHPVNGSNAVADSVYVYASQTLGSRYGANAWWWTQKNTGVYPAQYEIMKHSVQNQGFTGVQFANSGTNDSAAFGAGGMPEAMNLAIQDGICYWEVWNSDILNPDFEDVLSHASCKTTSQPEFSVPDISIYPNPTQGILILEMDGEASVSIYNANGQRMNGFHLQGTQNINLKAMGLSPGIYFIRIEMEGKASSRMIVLE